MPEYRVEPSLSILTWNLMGHDRIWRERLELVAEEIRFWRPQVVCLQETSIREGVNTAELLSSLTGLSLVTQSSFEHVPQSTAILSSLEVRAKGNVIFAPYPTMKWRDSFTHASLLSPSGRLWHVGSAHLAWGSQVEPARLAQTENIVALFEEKERGTSAEQASVLAGDLNTLPDRPAAAYLTGRYLGTPATMWVDAWEAVGDGEGATSTPDNYWSEASALDVGIVKSTALPHRRIDYIFTKGYAYGRPGTPLRAHLVGLQKGSLPPPSDHYGVIADLWDPLVPPVTST